MNAWCALCETGLCYPSIPRQVRSFYACSCGLVLRTERRRVGKLADQDCTRAGANKAVSACVVALLHKRQPAGRALLSCSSNSWCFVRGGSSFTGVLAGTVCWAISEPVAGHDTRAVISPLQAGVGTALLYYRMSPIGSWSRHGIAAFMYGIYRYFWPHRCGGAFRPAYIGHRRGGALINYHANLIRNGTNSPPLSAEAAPCTTA